MFYKYAPYPLNSLLLSESACTTCTMVELIMALQCRVPPAAPNGSKKVEGSMSSGEMPESDVNNNGTKEAVSGSKGGR